MRMVNLPSGWEAFLPVYAGILFVAAVGVVTRSESRTILLAIAAAILAPTPASLFVAGLVSLVVKPLGLVKL